MAQTITAQELINDVRVMSGLRNNQLFSDDDISDLLTDAGNELYDIVEGSFEHYFIQKFDFTLTSTSNIVDLPADFKRDNSVDRNPTDPNPETLITLGSWLERNQFNNAFAPSCRRYWIAGTGSPATLEVFPEAQAAGSYRLFYTPQMMGLSATVLPGYQRYQRTFTFSSSDNYATGTFTLANANATTFDVGGLLAPAAAVPNTALNGPYVISSVTPPSGVTVTGGPGFSPTRPITGSVTIYDLSVSSLINGVSRALSFASGGFDQTYIAASVTIAGATHSNNNGIWTVLSVPDQYHLVIGDSGNVMSSEIFPSTAVISIQRQYTTPTLPQSLVPWAVYLKTHASIAIRTSRQQDSSDLQAKLAALKTRVEKSVKNKTESPRQVPDYRRNPRRLGNGWGW